MNRSRTAGGPRPSVHPRPRRAGRRRGAGVRGFLASLVLAFGPACSKSPTEPTPTPPPTVDTSEIDAAVTASGLDLDALFPLGEISLADSAALSVSSAVAPLAFRRFFPRTDYANAYTFADTVQGEPMRVVTLRCKYQKGVFELVKQLAPDDPTPGDSSDRLVDKTMNGDWMRTIELKRGSAAAPWQVTAVSPVYLGVDDKRVCADCHATLEEVRLQSGPIDVTLHGDSLKLDSLVVLPSFGTTTVTARSRNDAHVVLLHDAAGSHVLRRAAPNLFSGIMAVGARGRHHFTVEVLSDSSLFDDRVRVSQHGWTFLYAVGP